jgi:phenylacetate-coenzyme A ligase PaaK-like adenylate-forming protein
MGSSMGCKTESEDNPGLKQKMKSTLVLSGYRLSDRDFRNFTEVISNFKPYLLTSYPSILFAFASFIRKEGLNVELKAIKSAGEKLHDFQRSFIEDVFKTKIYDFYGARDMPMVAMQCGHDSGLHQMAENVIVEVLDDTGNPLKEGEGDLVITDFITTYSLYPLLLGDRARIISGNAHVARILCWMKS